MAYDYILPLGSGIFDPKVTPTFFSELSVDNVEKFLLFFRNDMEDLFDDDNTTVSDFSFSNKKCIRFLDRKYRIFHDHEISDNGKIVAEKKSLQEIRSEYAEKISEFKKLLNGESDLLFIFDLYWRREYISQPLCKYSGMSLDYFTLLLQAELTRLNKYKSVDLTFLTYHNQLSQMNARGIDIIVKPEDIVKFTPEYFDLVANVLNNYEVK